MIEIIIRSNLIGYINLGHSKINGSGLNVMVLHAKLACRVVAGLFAVRSLCADSIILN